VSVPLISTAVGDGVGVGVGDGVGLGVGVGVGDGVGLGVGDGVGVGVGVEMSLSPEPDEPPQAASASTQDAMMNRDVDFLLIAQNPMCVYSMCYVCVDLSLCRLKL